MNIQLGSSDFGVNSKLIGLTHPFQSSFAPVSLRGSPLQMSFPKNAVCLNKNAMQIGTTCHEHYW